jgi:hypothetical protein
MTEKNEVIAVYTLSNNIDYFLQSVSIVEYQIGFQLIVIHNNHVWVDKYYITLPAAKQAFTMLYKYKLLRPATRPIWISAEPTNAPNESHGGRGGKRMIPTIRGEPSHVNPFK